MNLNIAQLDRSLPDSVVVTAHWTASLTEGDLTASSYGTCSFEQKDPSDPNFIPFDDLTEEVVLGWVQDKMGEEQVAALQANLNNQMDVLKNPTSASGVPWQPAE